MPAASRHAGLTVADSSSRTVDLVVGFTLVCYICARALEIAPTSLPRTPIVALDVCSALAFALIDGGRRYRLRGMLIFTAICIVVGNVVENLGVATGFPFGHYYFVELMGPKLWHVPVLLGLAYIGMSYVSWSVARLIVSPAAGQLSQARLFLVPFVAAFVMTAWDLAQDPVWSTLLHGWVWRDGGRWFGVPVSNYLGWYGTVLLIYLLFAIYLGRRPARQERTEAAASRPALLFYALCALGNILQTVSRQPAAQVYDPAGKAWLAADILRASAMVSVFVMGSFAALAGLRLAARRRR
jgi:putative membrane protein